MLFFSEIKLIKSSKHQTEKKNHKWRCTLRTLPDREEVTNAKGSQDEVKEFCLGRERKKMERLPEAMEHVSVLC